LLIQYIFALVDPLSSVLSRFPSAVSHEFAAIVGLRAQRFPHFTAWTGRVQYSYQRTHSQSGEEPNKIIAISIRHNPFPPAVFNLGW
jgi:hypothetical protein